jgi:predicted GNAT superfamily acetyltransferase
VRENEYLLLHRDIRLPVSAKFTAVADTDGANVATPRASTRSGLDWPPPVYADQVVMIRDAVDSDFPALLALNAESERFLSPMDSARLQRLHRMAAYHRVVEMPGTVVAFLLAFREGADYDSPNYRWFGERYPRFLYIDRVVVAAAEQGRRLGAMLYDDLFAFARTDGTDRIACEFDIDPPNEASRRFHARYGFHEVGTQWVAGGRKQVSLQEASSELPSP